MRSLGWELIAIGWLGQLVLVGGAAAITGARPSQISQLGAFGRGLVQLARAIVPCLAAAAAIAIGGLALVVPGLVLLVLLALTGASRARGVPASLADSIAVVRARSCRPSRSPSPPCSRSTSRSASVAQRALVVPLPRQPAPAQLAQLRQLRARDRARARRRVAAAGDRARDDPDPRRAVRRGLA